MLHALIITALTFYAIGSFAALLLFSSRAAKLGRVPLFCAMLGMAAHTASYAFLLGQALSIETTPIRGRGDYYYLLSWVVAALFLLFRRRWNSAPIAALALGFATLFLVSSSLLVHQESREPIAKVSSSLFILHIVPALAAEAALIFAFILSLAFLYKEFLLRRRLAASISQGGPSLEQLGNVSVRFLLVGFVAMTIAVLSGTVWALGEGTSILSKDPLQWSAFVAWILLGALLHGRQNMQWSMRRTALVAAVTVGIVLLSFLALVVTEGNIFHVFQ